MGNKRQHGTAEDRLVSPEEFRTLTGFPRDPLYAALRSGSCPSIRIGNRYYLPLQPAMAWLGSLGVKPDTN